MAGETFATFELYNASDLVNQVTYNTQGSFAFDTATGDLKWSAVPEPTTTLAGIPTLTLPLPRFTVIAFGAVPVRLAVQVEVPGAFTVPGVQLNPLNGKGTVKVIGVERLLPLSAAVTFAV